MRSSGFARSTAPLRLRHVFSVTTQASDSINRALALASTRRQQLETDRSFAESEYRTEKELTESLKNLVSLRIGGAKVLAPAHRPVMAQPERSALHFSAVRPKDSGLCQQLCAALGRLRIQRLTELQGALIPQLLRGKHIIGHSETGTGKSFGIALATCNRMMREQTTGRLHTLILVPTDALALQYERWLRHFAGSSRQIVLAAISHYPLEHQLAQLHNVQPHVLVGTPQRLSEIASLCPVIIGVKLRSKVDCIVLDEADVLLKTPITPPTDADARVASKFESRLDGLGRNSANVLSCGELIDRLYRSEATELAAQIVATSATFDGETSSRLNTWMRNQDVVRLTTSVEEQSVPSTLSFHFVAETRDTPLHELLVLTLQHIACQVAKPKVLIFADDANYDVSDLVRFVSQIDRLPAEVHDRAARADDGGGGSAVCDGDNRWTAVSLQEDYAAADAMSSTAAGEAAATTRGTAAAAQPFAAKRPIESPLASRRRIVGRNGEIFCFNDSNLSRLDVGKANVGVAHYSLARGLHISNVTHVIMYGSVPGATEFLHCAGRTARRKTKGDVVCVFSPADGRHLQHICVTLGIPWQINRAADFRNALRHSVNEVRVADGSANGGASATA